ncbi:MAG: hypothetical protein IKF52_04070 [Clostridia bacterium]|nr:hypothetical protein [Clostridia bacterium]
MESKVYFKRLIVIAVFIVLSLALAYPAKDTLIKEYNSIEDAIEFVEMNDEDKVKDEMDLSKEEALDYLNKLKNYYDFVDKNSEVILYLGLALGLFGVFSGFMIYFILTGLLLKKAFPDFKSWMSWLMRIIVLVLLFNFLYVPIGLLGLFLCVPNLIYHVYKYLKTRNIENKEDYIVE